MDFKTQLKLSISSIVLGSIVGVAIAYLGYGVCSLVWSAIVQALVSTLKFWYFFKWRPLFIFNIQKFKYHFHYGIKVVLSGILDIFFTNAYTIFIGRFFAPA